MINARPHLERIAGYALADLGESDLISLAQNESAIYACHKVLYAKPAVRRLLE